MRKREKWIENGRGALFCVWGPFLLSILVKDDGGPDPSNSETAINRTFKYKFSVGKPEP
jgi:hypothetical protein